MLLRDKVAVVTGAASKAGIGRATARRFAQEGARVALLDLMECDPVAAARELGPEHVGQVCDVRDRAALDRWLAELDRAHPLDLVIANAGVSAGTGSFGETAEQTRDILTVNVDGVVNTALAAIELMRPRGRGQIAIMASLAAFRGFPGAPAYCASKAAVRVWGEALRGMVHAQGLRVSVICPGYVKSRMTAVNDFPMPFLMEAGKAARIIRRGLAADKARIVFPRRLFAVVWLLALLPPAWTDPLLRRLPEKPAGES